jgi:hypothetical protein
MFGNFFNWPNRGVNSWNFCESAINAARIGCDCGGYPDGFVIPNWNFDVFGYFAFGKLPENPVITPGTTVQVVRPSAANRYLQTVTVEAVTTPTP